MVQANIGDITQAECQGMQETKSHVTLDGVGQTRRAVHLVSIHKCMMESSPYRVLQVHKERLRIDRSLLVARV